MVTFGLAVPAALCGFDTALAGRGATPTLSPSAWMSHLEVPGVDELWVLDQMMGNTPTADSIAILSHVAALSQQVRLGIAVLVGAARGPVGAAKALATLDWLSDGRLDVGLGLGGPHHYPAYGIDRAGGGGAGAILDEFISQLTRLWTEDRVTAAGRTWTLHDVAVNPKPCQRPHPPLWIGGGGERSLQRAVDHAAGYIGAGRHSNAEFIELATRLQAILDERGRPPGFRISKRVYIVVNDDRAEADRVVDAWFKRFYGRPELGPHVTVAGDVASCVAELSTLVDAGCDHLLLHPLEEHPDQYDVLTQAVMPALRNAR